MLLFLFNKKKKEKKKRKKEREVAVTFKHNLYKNYNLKNNKFR